MPPSRAVASPPAIAKTIGERYPADRATGCRLGDLRGIVVVESR